MPFEWFDLGFCKHTISTTEIIVSDEMGRMWIVTIRVF